MNKENNNNNLNRRVWLGYPTGTLERTKKGKEKVIVRRGAVLYRKEYTHNTDRLFKRKVFKILITLLPKDIFYESVDAINEYYNFGLWPFQIHLTYKVISESNVEKDHLLMIVVNYSGRLEYNQKDYEQAVLLKDSFCKMAVRSREWVEEVVIEEDDILKIRNNLKKDE